MVVNSLLMADLKLKTSDPLKTAQIGKGILIRSEKMGC